MQWRRRRTGRHWRRRRRRWTDDTWRSRRRQRLNERCGSRAAGLISARRFVIVAWMSNCRTRRVSDPPRHRTPPFYATFYGEIFPNHVRRIDPFRSAIVGQKPRSAHPAGPGFTLTAFLCTGYRNRKRNGNLFDERKRTRLLYRTKPHKKYAKASPKGERVPESTQKELQNGSKTRPLISFRPLRRGTCVENYEFLRKNEHFLR